MNQVTRRGFLRAAGTSAAALAGGSFLPGWMGAPAGAATGRGSAKPNFVFFLVDDLGWADVACYGSRYYETPNIDRLAADGVRFTDAYAACPVCSPTRASILTGKYPARLDLTDWIPGHRRKNAKLLVPEFNQQLPLEEVTIAEALKEAGYATAAMGKWHLGTKDYYPTEQGFDLNVGGTRKGQPPHYFHPERIPTMPPGYDNQNLTDALTVEAEKFIESNRDRPFFLYFSYYAVHTPIQGKEDLAAKYRAKPPHGGQDNPEYAAMIETVDTSVGRVRAKLEALGIADRTILIFMSDNGGLGRVTSNAPLRAGKGTLYEGGIREPMIVRWPGVTRPGRVCGTPVTSTDLYPTILEMAGLPLRPEQHADGLGLAGLLRGNEEIDRDTLYWHYPHYHQTTPAGAIRHGRYKLIEYFEDGRMELYDLRNDVGETTDLAERMPSKVREMHTRLAVWRESLGAKMPTPNPDYVPKNRG